MDAAIAYVKTQNVQDYVQIIKILMESAEKQSTDGSTKYSMVIDAWKKISTAPEFKNILGGVSLETVNGIVEAIILATTTTIAVNKGAGCWKSFLSIFKKKA